MKKLFLSLIAMLASVAVSAGEFVHRAVSAHMCASGLVLHAVPDASLFNSRRVTNPDQSEIIRQSLYDFQLYPTAGAQQMSFFSQQQGTGITTALGGTVGAAKSINDTNQQLANQLPSGKAFLAESIEVFFLPGSVSTANTYTPANAIVFATTAAAAVGAAVNDTNSFYQSGALRLNILSKEYLTETPLGRFPPKTQLDVQAGLTSNSSTLGLTISGWARQQGRPYYLEPTIALQPAVNYEVLLLWPAAVTTPSGFNARVGVVLDGFLMRASQ